MTSDVTAAKCTNTDVLQSVEMLEKRVCLLIVLAERIAVAPNQWLGRKTLQNRLQAFCFADLCAVARLESAASVFWRSAHLLAHCNERDVREVAATTILNFKSVRWRVSQKPRPEHRRRADLN